MSYECKNFRLDNGWPELWIGEDCSGRESIISGVFSTMRRLLGGNSANETSFLPMEYEVNGDIFQRPYSKLYSLVNLMP